jgi:hypothetical protein
VLQLEETILGGANMGYGRKSELRDGIEQVFCSRCHEYKPVGNFNLRTPLLHLYQYYCRECQAAIDKVNHEAELNKRGRKLVRRIPDSDVSYCSRCKTWKPKNEFNFWDVTKGILQYYCRDCQHATDREHYVAHTERVLETNKASRIKGREKAQEHLYNVLSGSKCADCGTTDAKVLTFDHVKGKKKHNVSNMVSNGMALGTIYAEIEKTEIVCFNCHMKREQRRKGSFRLLW